MAIYGSFKFRTLVLIAMDNVSVMVGSRLIANSLAHCWLSGLTGSLAPLLLAPWLIASSQTAWVIGCLAHSWHSDSLLPPCHLANFLAHRWLSGTLAGSLAPCLLPGSLLAPWLLIGSLAQCWLTGAWFNASSRVPGSLLALTHCCLPVTLLTPWLIAGSLGSLLVPWLLCSLAPCWLLVPWLLVGPWLNAAHRLLGSVLAL